MKCHIKDGYPFGEILACLGEFPSIKRLKTMFQMGPNCGGPQTIDTPVCQSMRPLSLFPSVVQNGSVIQNEEKRGESKSYHLGRRHGRDFGLVGAVRVTCTACRAQMRHPFSQVLTPRIYFCKI